MDIKDFLAKIKAIGGATRMDPQLTAGSSREAGGSSEDVPILDLPHPDAMPVGGPHFTAKMELNMRIAGKEGRPIADVKTGMLLKGYIFHAPLHGKFWVLVPCDIEEHMVGPDAFRFLKASKVLEA